MIRKFSLLFGLFAYILVFVVGTPFVAEAELFVRQGPKTNESSDGKKKRSYFLSPKKKSSQSNQKQSKAYYKKKTISYLNLDAPKTQQFEEASPILLSRLGEMPKDPKEILERAQAYRVFKVKNMLEIQKQDSHRANLARLNAESKARMIAENVNKSKSKDSKDKPKKKKYSYTHKTNRHSIKKPRKVFNSNR